MVAVDRVFKVPLLAANGAEPAPVLNARNSTQIDNVTEAEGEAIQNVFSSLTKKQNVVAIEFRMLSCMALQKKGPA